VSGTRLKVNTREVQMLEELVSEFLDIFATKCGDYWCTDKFYNHIDTGDAHPICDPHIGFC
jgi:hypothetical protein